MLKNQINLKINSPTGPLRAGRGFYQLEDEALFVQIGLFTEKRHFFNYLENDRLLFDINREGQLIFIEVDLAKRHWVTDNKLAAPTIAEVSSVKWLHFRETLPDCTIFTNDTQTIMKIEFYQSSEKSLYYYLADNVIVETDTNNNLLAIWVTQIIDDLAGRAISKFRKKYRLAKSYFA